MRALEHWIALQVVGSKNRVRTEGLYTVKALLNSRDYSQTLLQVCDRVHCNALTFLRKQGDTTAYGAASKDRLAQSINESDDTPEHKKVASDLVEMLDRFCRKEGKSFGWDPLETEAQNRRRLQLPVAVNASVQNAGKQSPFCAHTILVLKGACARIILCCNVRQATRATHRLCDYLSISAPRVNEIWFNKNGNSYYLSIPKYRLDSNPLP